MKKYLLVIFSLLCLGVLKGQFKDILTFNGPNGSNPYGSLIRSGKILYGMTEYGGVKDSGNIFSIDTNGTGYKDLFDFTLSKGTFPTGNLTLSGGVMYGMTVGGGPSNDGSIFSIDTNGTGYKTLHFFNGINGSYPYGSLTLSGNTFYGMTWAGGKHGSGCIFSIDTNGSGYTDIFDFGSADTGTNPYGSLILSGSTLYGMTYSGGIYSYGSIFSIQTNGTGYTDLHDFYYSLGDYPYGSLTLSGSKLFGMTEGGGTDEAGVVFSLNTNGTGYKVLINFFGLYGNFSCTPKGSLILSGKKLYGMTENGGDGGGGNVFSIDTSGSVYEDLFLFNFANGYQPTGDVILSGKILYGMTSSGGSHDAGVVFSLDTTTLSVTQYIPTPVSCRGGNNGSDRAYPIGGCYPFTYLWNPGGQTNALATGLSAGSYTVTVRSSCGHSASMAVTITQPSILRDSISSFANTVCNNNGSVTVGVKGGTGPYAYLWSPGGKTTATASGLSAGLYTIRVTDSRGCTATSSVTITGPAAIRDSMSSITYTHCYGGTGSATVGVKGGVLPYTYLWNPGGKTTSAITGLSIGTYTLTITDKNVCSSSTSVTITQPPKLRDSISSSTCLMHKANATVGVKGGIVPYTYLWTPSAGTTAIMTGLSNGTYTIKVTDNSGCSATTVKSFLCPGVLTNTRDSLKENSTNEVIVYPNPNKGMFTVQLSVVNGQSLVEIYNILGQSVLKEPLRSVQGSNLIDLSAQPSGIYLYRVTKEDGTFIGEGKIVVQK